MTDCSSKEASSAYETNILNFLVGGTMLTFPYLFIWYLMSGAEFVETYIWYLKSVLYVGSVISVLTTVALAANRRWRSLFEKPSHIPNWLVGVAGGFTLVICIIDGILDGWATGMLAFWPSVFATACVAHGFNWIMHQVRRWMAPHMRLLV